MIITLGTLIATTLVAYHTSLGQQLGKDSAAGIEAAGSAALRKLKGWLGFGGRESVDAAEEHPADEAAQRALALIEALEQRPEDETAKAELAHQIDTVADDRKQGENRALREAWENLQVTINQVNSNSGDATAAGPDSVAAASGATASRDTYEVHNEGWIGQLRNGPTTVNPGSAV
ncbi:MAG: hypothetical protein LBM66_06380 [Bifidobacteriaceae bacterium]|jgi:hypothetical protein|nr:hypothetical protein [Bifidobacteriaceae bacterium]